MKPPFYMKMSFDEQKPSYVGTIKGGWVKVPPNNDVGLPCSTWVSFAWYYRIWIAIKVLSRIRFRFRWRAFL